MTDEELYGRGARTLLACWSAVARGSRRAAVLRLSGVACAVFAHEPERTIYNNALLERGLGPAERAETLAAMEAAYASAGVERFAAWAHEAEEALQADLAARGYTLAETTRAMGMTLDDLRAPRPELELAAADWPVYVDFLAAFGAPPGLLSGVDPEAFHLLVVRSDGETVGTALAFDEAGDCGIFNVFTAEHLRRRGMGTALTALCLHDARGRGCRTASLQSTEMAERVYAGVGFRDLGRFLEYAPSPRPPSATTADGVGQRGGIALDDP